VKVLIWSHTLSKKHAAGLRVATEAKRQGLQVRVTGGTSRPREMLSVLYDYKPDVVLCFVVRHGFRPYYEAIKRSGAKLVLWYPDMTELKRDRMWNMSLNNVADALVFSILETAQRYRHLAPNVIWIPQYFDHNFCLKGGRLPKRLDPTRQIYDLCFIGSCDSYRSRWLDILKANYPNSFFARDGIKHRREIRGNAMAQIYAQSRIAINLQRKAFVNPGPYVTSNRIYNAMGSGAFVLSHYINQLDLVFQEDMHCAMFDDTRRNLFAKIDYFLSHEELREVIARTGQRQVLQYHTLEHRIKQYWQVMAAVCGGYTSREDVSAFGQWVVTGSCCV